MVTAWLARAFGATPAYLAFLWGLHDLGRIGWLLPLFYLMWLPHCAGFTGQMWQVNCSCARCGG